MARASYAADDTSEQSGIVPRAPAADWSEPAGRDEYPEDGERGEHPSVRREPEPRVRVGTPRPPDDPPADEARPAEQDDAPGRRGCHRAGGGLFLRRAL